jgi:hypothetical protein
LDKVAKLRRGFVTGFNDFFILDKEKIKLWKIESEYLKPIVASIKDLKRVELTAEDISNWILMVHEPKEELMHKRVLKYLEHGEEMEVSTKRGTRIASDKVKGVNNLSTCKSRKIWYDLGKHEIPLIIAPYLMWDRVVFVYNRAKALAPNTLHFVYPMKREETQYLLGILNSTLTAFLLEIEGRSYGGGVLKMEAYEMATLPIINPEKVSKKNRSEIESAFSNLYQVQKTGDAASEKAARAKLDNAVFDVLKLKKKERKQIYEGLESLRKMRLQRKEVDVLVETAEKWKPHKKPKEEKRAKLEPSKRLDTWMERKP